MALWRNIVRLARAGSMQGVVEPGPTDVLTPLQAVQVTDDVSAATPPPALPFAIWRCQLGVPGAGLYSAVRFIAGARGLYIPLIRAGAATTETDWSASAGTIGIVPPGPLAAAPTTLVQWAGRNITSSLSQSNTEFNGAIGGLTMQMRTAGTVFLDVTPYTFYLQPGEVLTIAHATAVQAMDLAGFLAEPL